MKVLGKIVSASIQKHNTDAQRRLRAKRCVSKVVEKAMCTQEPCDFSRGRFRMVMCVFMPIMAVIYDVGQYRMYQQDIKNIQEIAGLACIGVAKGSFNATGSGDALGAFDAGSCKDVAANVAAANLGLNYNRNVFTSTWGNDVRKNRNYTSLAPCNGTFTRENIVTSRVDTGGHNFALQIKGLCYYPTFMKKNVLNFQATAHNKTPFNGSFKKSYPIEVMPSIFSAVFLAN